MQKKKKAIPYGKANFLNLKAENDYFVDKTHFISLLEESGKFLMLIRPRRMGKSLWISILEHYYDINFKEQFEEIFCDTQIVQSPTPERNSYLILRFDFSQVDATFEQVQSSFESHCQIVLSAFLNRYSTFFSSQEIQQIQTSKIFAEQLQKLFHFCSEKELKLYFLIDEYDNFSNTILSVEGQTKYHELTHGAGSFKHFFKLLKGGSSFSLLGGVRLFMIGVSPVTLDDVSSGANNIKNISLWKRFHNLLGFSQGDVEAMLGYYGVDQIVQKETHQIMEIMQEWYNHYRFSSDTQAPLYNPDMVLYFVDHIILNQNFPKFLIDRNVRIDYQKLKSLIFLDQKLNGNFSLLKIVMENGGIQGDVVESFPIEDVTARENFQSLLYYFGLLTYGESQGSRAYLAIPNRTVYSLIYGYIREAWKDTNCFRVSPYTLSQKLGDMAYDGEWQGFFQFIAEQIKDQTSIHDYLHNEKVIQGFLLAYLNVADYFLTYTEFEANKGRTDFYLAPFQVKYPDLTHGYLIELKYFKRNAGKALKGTDNSAQEEKIKELLTEAKEQLQQYDTDSRFQELQKIRTGSLKKIALIFCGWELVLQQEV